MRFRWSTQTRSVPSFGNANLAWQTRSGVLVVAQASDGQYGVGEATPLPGYSPDTVADVEAWLARLDAATLQIDTASTLTAVLAELDVVPNPPPSALLAAQTACLDLWTKRRQTSVEYGLWHSAATSQRARFSPTGELPLSLAPLLDLASPAVVPTLSALLERGYTTYKVKIGSNLDHELAVLHALASLSQPSHPITFRLDANQSLDPAHLIATLTRFTTLRIEYIEEPCALHQLPEVPLPLPLALDESLQRGWQELSPLLSSGRLAAIVCKPMVVGDLREVVSWHSRACHLGCAFVLSHLFDGAIAFRLYSALARVLAPNTCHGLFPHAALGLWNSEVAANAGPGLGLELTRPELVESPPAAKAQP